MAERIIYNLFQVAFVLAFAPLVEGITSRLKEILQSKRGPSIFQPYRDLWKLLHKDEIVSEHTSWIFRAAPYVAFTAPIFVALLIPVLTRYPLFFAFMGDMLGGGFVLDADREFLRALTRAPDDRISDAGPRRGRAPSGRQPVGAIRAGNDRPLQTARVFGTRRGPDEMGRRDEVPRSDLHLSECAGHSLGSGTGNGLG